MGQITEQVHNKFKVFAGNLDADKGLGDLDDKVSAFVKDNKLAAKSIGVEYLESVKRLIITLGYRNDEEHYPVRLHAVNLGKIEMLDDDFSILEQKMSEAGGNLSNVICHELFITEEHDFLMVFMTTE